MAYLKIGKELKKMLKGEKSFLGVDGGRIKSDIWFCGIEFGGNLEKMQDYCKDTVRLNNTNDFEIPVPYRKDYGAYKNSFYDRYLSAMYINLFKEEKLVNADDLKPIEGVLNDELYNKNSKIFKLNLFPLAKNSIDWDKNITEKFGISKESYYGEIFKTRMVFFKELVTEFKPKIIICTSTSEYHEKFLEAFFVKNQPINYSFDYVENNGNHFKISKYISNEITLIIIPFLGRGGLRSYDDVICMANYLRESTAGKHGFTK